MASYVNKSIGSRAYLPEICGETLETISQLDVLQSKVHKAIDSTVGAARSRRMTSKRQIAEVQAMRNVSEALCEKKAQLALLSYDLIDDNIRQLDAEIKVLEQAMNNNGDPRLRVAIHAHGGGGGERERRTQNGDTHGGGAQGGMHGSSSSSSSASGVSGAMYGDMQGMDGMVGMEPEIDPNEPIYCLCRNIAHGDMIACDNEDCAIEWFHYACVNLTKKPRSTWLCMDCKSKKPH